MVARTKKATREKEEKGTDGAQKKTTHHPFPFDSNKGGLRFEV